MFFAKVSFLNYNICMENNIDNNEKVAESNFDNINDINNKPPTPYKIIKYVALVLLIILPFLGFWLGMKSTPQVIKLSDFENENMASGETVPFCDEVSQRNLDLGASCYVRNKIGAIPLCEEIEYPNSYDQCYFDYAQSGKDRSLCMFIKDNEKVRQCFDYFKIKEVVIELNIWKK